jgi:hypothetical protein
MSHPNELRGSLDLLQQFKWKFLLPTLLIQKPPSIHGIKGRDLLPIVLCRMKQYDGSDWVGFIANNEHDVLLAHKIV